MNVKLGWGFPTIERALSELNRALKSLFGEIKSINVVASWKDGKEHNTILNIEGKDSYPKIVDVKMYRKILPRTRKPYWFIEISFFLDVEREKEIELARKLLEEELKSRKNCKK